MAAIDLEMACGRKCHSKQHSYELNTAITRGNTRQLQLFLSLCHNATSISDRFLRTAVHMAASVGKWEVVKWLLEKKADLSVKDLESGYTALHRALFYGQLSAARCLIAYGANIQLRDKEGLNPLDLTMKDRPSHVEFSLTGLTEVFTWGDSANFTLGHDTEQRRKTPEVVEFFRKHSISIKQVVMNKYHTVFLSVDGRVYTCGHGRGGRLGHGQEQTILVPHLVDGIKGEICLQVAAGRDHTVLLMESGAVYSFGLNDSHLLGQFPPAESSLLPKPMNRKILKGKVVHGVCAGRFHTVLYTSDSVFTFGLNAGQLGHLKVPGELNISQPRQVSALNHKDVEIKLVAASDAATAIVTMAGDVYVLHEYQCRKIVSKRLDIVQIVTSGGHLDHHTDLETLREKGGTELVICLLNSSGKVYIWRGTDPVLKRCAWAIRRPLFVTNISLSLNSIAFITKDGEAFLGNVPWKSRPQSAKDSPQQKGDLFNMSVTALVEREGVEDIRIERLPLIHRAVFINQDKKGQNFTVLQIQPNASLTDVPVIEDSKMESRFSTLLREANDIDLIHDVILKVGENCIAAHKYILAFRSEYFHNIFTIKSETMAILPGEKPVVPVENVPLEIFLQMLQFIYTDSCILTTVGSKFEVKMKKSEVSDERSSFGEGNVIDIEIDKKVSAFEVYQKQKKKKGQQKQNIEKKEGHTTTNPVKLLQEMAKKFGVKNLAKRLEAVKYANGSIQSVHGKHLPRPKLKFDRNKYSHLYDVCIRADNKMIQCHKAVLVARLEYFHSMLGSGWIETSNLEALTLPVPGDILEIVLDFLYTDDAPTIESCEDVEFNCNVLVVADQLLIERLKNICEVAISNLLSLRNACEILEFASVYNAAQLKATCQQFICLNLAAVLENRSLEILSDDVAAELTRYYRDNTPAMSRRMITPYDEWPSSDYLEQLEEDYEGVDTDSLQSSTIRGHKEDTATLSVKKGKPKKKRNRTRSSGEEVDGFKARERLISTCSDDLEEVTEDKDGNKESRVKLPNATSVQPLRILQWVKDKSLPGIPRPNKLGISDLSKGTDIVEPGVAIQTEQGASSPPITPAESPPALGLRDIMAQQKAANTTDSKCIGSLSSISSSGSKKAHKLSQKERKKLQQSHSQEDFKSGPSCSPQADGGAKPKTWASSPTNAWSPVSQVAQSFRDLMLHEEKCCNKPALVITASKQPQEGSTGDSVISWGLSTGASRAPLHQPPESPSSPSSPTSPQSSENPWFHRENQKKAVSFTEIVKDEIHQTETLQKAAKKPLALIQIEEQAMQELMDHYRRTATPDEHISVERVPSILATPTWAATSTARQ